MDGIPPSREEAGSPARGPASLIRWSSHRLGAVQCYGFAPERPRYFMRPACRACGSRRQLYFGRLRFGCVACGVVGLYQVTTGKYLASLPTEAEKSRLADAQSLARTERQPHQDAIGP